MHLPQGAVKGSKQEGPTEHSSGPMFTVPAPLPIFLQRQLQGPQPVSSHTILGSRKNPRTSDIITI